MSPRGTLVRATFDVHAVGRVTHANTNGEALDGWLARYADGDRSAFDPLFAAAWPVVLGFTRRLVGDRADAEDVAQRTMIKLAQQASRYDRERPALGWILTIAAWEAKSARKTAARRRARQVELRPELGPGSRSAAEGPDDAPTPEATVLRRELHDALTHALEQLSDLDRQTLLDDIHEHIDPDLRPATRRKRRQRALERLRGIWRLTHDS